MLKMTKLNAPFAGVLVAALLGGCASSYPRPDDQLSATEAAITAAESAKARAAAPVLLNSAQNKLLEAREAIDNELYRKATWLLEDAQAEADLAKAKAETEATRKAVAELEDSIGTLRDRIGNPAR